MRINVSILTGSLLIAAAAPGIAAADHYDRDVAQPWRQAQYETDRYGRYTRDHGRYDRHPDARRTVVVERSVVREVVVSRPVRVERPVVVRRPVREVIVERPVYVERPAYHATPAYPYHSPRYDDRSALGAIGGAVVGAVIGSQVTHSAHRAAGTVAGAVIGGVIGSRF